MLKVNKSASLVTNVRHEKHIKWLVGSNNGMKSYPIFFGDYDKQLWIIPIYSTIKMEDPRLVMVPTHRQHPDPRSAWNLHLCCQNPCRAKKGLVVVLGRDPGSTGFCGCQWFQRQYHDVSLYFNQRQIQMESDWWQCIVYRQVHVGQKSPKCVEADSVGSKVSQTVKPRCVLGNPSLTVSCDLGACHFRWKCWSIFDLGEIFEIPSHS